MVNNVLCHFGLTFIVNKNRICFYINVDATMITYNPELIVSKSVRRTNIIPPPPENANLPYYWLA